MPKKFPEPQAFEEGAAPFIAMDSVESSQIKSVGYDPETKTLAVQFNYGKAVYHYGNVSQETYDAFMAAESVGTFFGAHIKDLAFKKYHADPVVA